MPADEEISVTDVLIDGNVTARPLNAPASSDPVAVADAHPADVVIDDSQIFKPEDNDTADWRIMIKVGDMAAGDAFPGEQGIDPGQPVTVTIAKAAGIKAPTEAGDFKMALAFGFEPGPDALIKITTLTTDILVTLSSQDGSRGDEIAATAKGISNDGDADFWLDANANHLIDPGETELCNNLAVSDNVAECSFKITPDFSAGHGGSVTDGCDGALTPIEDVASSCNLIKVRDGTGDTSKTDGEDDVLELKSSITLSPAEGNPGDRITVQLQDFDANGAAVTEVKISTATKSVCGGLETACPTNAVVADGDATFTITIPSVVAGTRVLTVYLSNDTDEDTEISIGGSSVISTPTTVLPNQTIALRGSGFSGETGAYIRQINLGSDNVYTEDDPSDPEIETDDNGSWNYSAVVPVTSATADGGDLTLRVTDSEQRTGTTVLTIPLRNVEINPEEGRIGSTITIRGTNYPVLNNSNDAAEDNIAVLVYYGELDDDDAEPDAAGSWTITMKVSNDADIPSTNVVRVTFLVDSNGDGAIGMGDVPEIDTFRHRVPGATISLSPAEGTQGSMVTLTATGFKKFFNVGSLTFGGRPIASATDYSTDRNGDVSFDFLVPGADPGIHNVIIDVDGTTASVGFTVVESTGVVGAVTTGVETALEPLLTAGTLDRVFYFNNSTKEWQWHIVDPDFAASNNLDDVVSGAPLWVLVTEDTSATLNNRVVDFSCAGDDCWNLVTFP